MKSNEKHLEVCVVMKDRELMVNVFTASEDKKVIREMAIERAIEFMGELGYIQGEDYDVSDMKPVGYNIKPQFEI